MINLREASWTRCRHRVGTWVGFEAEGVRQQFGIGVHMLMPGESPGRYHSESDQEGFLVLAGECVLVVEGEERRLRQWDFFHCPPGTAHITIGAGEEPCAIFMLGARTPGKAYRLHPRPGGREARRRGRKSDGLAPRRPTRTSTVRPSACGRPGPPSGWHRFAPASVVRPRGGPPCQSRQTAAAWSARLTVDGLEDHPGQVLHRLPRMHVGPRRHQLFRCRCWPRRTPAFRR